MYNTNRITNNSYLQIQRLYKESFNSNVDIPSIKKKYDTSAFGLKNVGIIAEDEKKMPAAYYGVFPIVLQYGLKDYLIAQSGDTMTSPNHRKKGLFTMLAIKTYELAKQLNIKLIFGFPNENSLPGFKKKLDWSFYGLMQRFTFTNTTLPFCELASKYKFFEPIYVKYTNNIISKHSLSVSNSNIEPFNISKSIDQIKKNEPFFKYKMENGNCSLIKINDFTLFIKPRTHLYIGAIGYFDKSKTKELIKTIKKLSVILGCRKTVLTLSKNHWLYEYLVEEIKPEDSLPIGCYLIDDNIDPNKIQFTHADFDTF